MLRWSEIVVVVAASTFIAWCAFTDPPFRQTTPRERRNNLWVVLDALRLYCDSFQSLPSTGRFGAELTPASSWRFQILRWIDNSRVTAAWDAPWTDPRNSHLREFALPVFCWLCGSGVRLPHTKILAVVGPGTAFDMPAPLKWNTLPQDLIVLVEMHDTGLHWMEPGDLELHSGRLLLKGRTIDRIVGCDGVGFHVAFADAQVWRLSDDTPLTELKKLFTIDGATQHDRIDVLGRYLLRARN